MFSVPSSRSAGRFHRLRRALSFAAPYRRAVLALFVITVVLALVNAAEPLVFKYVFDELAGAQAMHALVLGLVGLTGLGVIREVASGFSNCLTWTTRIGIHYLLLEAMVGRLHTLPLSF